MRRNALWMLFLAALALPFLAGLSPTAAQAPDDGEDGADGPAYQLREVFEVGQQMRETTNSLVTLDITSRGQSFEQVIRSREVVVFTALAVDDAGNITRFSRRWDTAVREVTTNGESQGEQADPEQGLTMTFRVRDGYEVLDTFPEGMDFALQAEYGRRPFRHEMPDTIRVGESFEEPEMRVRDLVRTQGQELIEVSFVTTLDRVEEEEIDGETHEIGILVSVIDRTIRTQTQMEVVHNVTRTERFDFTAGKALGATMTGTITGGDRGTDLDGEIEMETTFEYGEFAAPAPQEDDTPEDAPEDAPEDNPENQALMEDLVGAYETFCAAWETGDIDAIMGMLTADSPLHQAGVREQLQRIFGQHGSWDVTLIDSALVNVNDAGTQAMTDMTTDRLTDTPEGRQGVRIVERVTWVMSTNGTWKIHLLQALSQDAIQPEGE